MNFFIDIFMRRQCKLKVDLIVVEKYEQIKNKRTTFNLNQNGLMSTNKSR